MELNTAIITITTAILGVSCGAAAGAYFNLRSSRKDMLFKRKFEYFEKLSQDLERNLRLYKKAILSLSKSSKIKDIQENLNELRATRKSFMAMASPLYFDIAKMKENIISFVDIEKNIFSAFDKLIENHKSTATKARIIYELNESLNRLDEAGEKIILEMRDELKR
jgi:hypothetical protein